MNTTTTIVLAAGIVTIGRWSEGKTISLRIIVGASFVALILAAADNGPSADLSHKIAFLILLGAFFRYILSIIGKTGISKVAK